jgi:hypothetical protein
MMFSLLDGLWLASAGSSGYTLPAGENRGPS